MKDYTYVLIPRIKVQNANAMSGYWAMSSEVVMAARQMMHAFSRKVDEGEGECGVSIIHHTFQYLGNTANGQYSPQQRRGSNFIDKSDYAGGSSKSLSMQPTSSMHLKVSLVFRYEDAVIDEDDLNDCLLRAKLAGGTIIGHSKIKTFESADEVINYVGNGFVIDERYDFDELVDKPEQMIEKMFDLTSPPSKLNERDEKDSWIVPAVLGYAEISDKKHREGSRFDHETAYAEALVGLVQYKSLRMLDDTPLPFWNYQYPENGVFTLSTKS